MSHDIEAYCKTCSICVIMKDANNKPAGLLHSLPIPDRLWQSIGVDFIGSKFLMSTAFHLQTDGGMERANRSIAQILQIVVANDQKD